MVRVSASVGNPRMSKNRSRLALMLLCITPDSLSFLLSAKCGRCNDAKYTVVAA